MTTKTVVAAWVAFALVAIDADAQVPAGGEFQVNTYTTSWQISSRVGVSAQGAFVVTWASDGADGNGYGIAAQRYDADGTPRGGELVVNTYTTGRQDMPAISVTKKGDFVVAWTSAEDGSSTSVHARRYERDGNPTGAAFRVNTYTTGTQNLPRVGHAANGRFVVSWSSASIDGAAYGVAARRFDASGVPIGEDFVVNAYTTGDQDFSDLAVAANGDFVVVYEDGSGNGRDGSLSGIFGQRFAASGARLGGEFQVNTYTTGRQSAPSMGLGPGGGFVVAWTSAQGDGSGYGVFARRFDGAGNGLGADFVVNTYTTGDQGAFLGMVAADAGGNFAVSWSSEGQDGSSFGVFGQRFSPSGARRGAEFRVNTHTTDLQTGTWAASDQAGNFTVTWGSNGQDGSQRGIFAQRFGGLRPTALRVDVPGNLVLEPGETRAIQPTWRNETGGNWTLTTTLSTPGGPAGGVPQIFDPFGTYGTLANGAAGECAGCPIVLIPNPSPRPLVHWDGTVVESVLPDTQGQQQRWVLHVGASFTDVPLANPFYRFIETLLHHQVTGGCTATTYCPASHTTREQMAVFVLVAKEGPLYAPPACTAPAFNDVPASSPFCHWIAELARRGVVGGCGGGNYCPQSPVSREQMSVFVLLTLDPALNPPACTTPMYGDVPASNGFCRWIEELTRRQVVSGCGGGNYCPADPVTREQMGVFISETFSLLLYGP